MGLMMNVGQNTTEEDNFGAALDYKIALLLIENPSITDQEIGKVVGVCRQTANKHKNAPGVQKIIRETLSIPEKEIRRLTAKAMSRLETMLDDTDPKIRLSAALALIRGSSALVTRPLFGSFNGL